MGYNWGKEPQARHHEGHPKALSASRTAALLIDGFSLLEMSKQRLDAHWSEIQVLNLD